MQRKYLTTIGLEVHVQLKTRSKMFCGCPVEFGAGPNTHTCPVCLGLPGALPVMNEEALRMTALTGLMLGCEIPPVCKFDRKNYFYPDMPKNYQISQYDLPICLGGGVPLHDVAYPKDAQKSIAQPDKIVPLVRIHLEEDVAKSFHFETSTGIDFNRAGTPLMEIVSEPEIHSPEEAFAYLTVLQRILILSNVSDADMEKGQLRCDCNISVRPEGQSEFGTKIEIKNMNSISAVRRALAFEIDRQTAAVQRGQQLVQSTRRWDDASGETQLMRTKEMAHDYRYFPDPDLLPVHTDKLRSEAEQLADAARARIYAAEVKQEYFDAMLNAALRGKANWSLIEEYDHLLKYYRTAVATAPRASIWVINSVLPMLAENGISIKECPVTAERLAELANLIDAGTISNRQGKEVFHGMFISGKTAAEIIEYTGMAQESDLGAIEALCDQAIAVSPKAVAEYKAGKLQAINAIKGQVMKLSQGKANPNVVSEVLAKKLA